MAYTLLDPLKQTEIPVEVRVDRRLRRHAHWARRADGSILLRVPPRLRRREIQRLLRDIQAEMERSAARDRRRTDEALAQRAREINRKYFGGEVPWRAIRWVSNMKQRLGSVSLGGTTYGHIRLSDQMRHWPRWVVDYVIVHEFVHLLLPEEGHSARFWARVRQAYPRTDEARGFVKGFFFAQGQAFESED